MVHDHQQDLRVAARRGIRARTCPSFRLGRASLAWFGGTPHAPANVPTTRLVRPCGPSPGWRCPGKSTSCPARGVVGVPGDADRGTTRAGPSTHVVVNLANVGSTYGERVLNRCKPQRLFSYDGVRKCVRHLAEKKGLKVIGVVFQHFTGDSGRDRGATRHLEYVQEH